MRDAGVSLPEGANQRRASLHLPPPGRAVRPPGPFSDSSSRAHGAGAGPLMTTCRPAPSPHLRTCAFRVPGRSTRPSGRCRPPASRRGCAGTRQRGGKCFSCGEGAGGVGVRTGCSEAHGNLPNRAGWPVLGCTALLPPHGETGSVKRQRLTRTPPTGDTPPHGRPHPNDPTRF